MKEFLKKIRKFNEMYGLAVEETPVNRGHRRLDDFHDILSEEVAEAEDIVRKMLVRPDDDLEALTDMADWLGDMVVYCHTEAMRWGIPLDEVLGIIMESNYSKLGADGKPIYDERGKVMKGPGYFKPEPKIRELLAKKMANVVK